LIRANLNLMTLKETTLKLIKSIEKQPLINLNQFMIRSKLRLPLVSVVL
jgi:hypothetical protein